MVGLFLQTVPRDLKMQLVITVHVTSFVRVSDAATAQWL